MEITSHLREAAESRAIIELRSRSGVLPDDLRARLIGPHCQYARTLPTEHVAAVQPHSAAAATAHILVTEPCYWTPALPFLYRLQLQWQGEARQAATSDQNIGLRRLACVRNNLMWNARRVVLRGAAVDNWSLETLHAARAAEVAILTPRPTAELCAAADEHGVALMADLRGDAIEEDELERLSLHASVALVLVDDQQLSPTQRQQVPEQAILAVAARSGTAAEYAAPSSAARCDAVVVELDRTPLADDAPAAWARPIIAIRRGVSYADFHEARAACDRLQAGLAPAFNLAGYFVAP